MAPGPSPAAGGASASASTVRAAAVAAVSGRPPLARAAARHRNPDRVCAQGALTVDTAGGGGAAGENGVSPEGLVLHFLDEDEGKSREELMATALRNLQASREGHSSPHTTGGKNTDRIGWANDTWLKLYAIMDYVSCAPARVRPRHALLSHARRPQNHDHVLHTNEVIKGIQMVKHAWKMCADMLWPVELLSQDQRLPFHGMVERMVPRLDDVQALALALSDGDQLSWTKSTHFIQASRPPAHFRPPRA